MIGQGRGEPVSERPGLLRVTTILHGRVVGLEEVKGRVDIRLKVRGARKINLHADPAVATKAADMFRADARVRATVLRGPNGDPDDTTWRMESIEPWEPGDFLEGVDEVRRRLHESGVGIDLRRALASLRDD